MRQVRAFLKAKNIKTTGQKQKQVIRIFADAAGLKITGNPTLWLLDLWASEADERCRRTEKDFYQSSAWLTLRAEILERYGSACMRCGSGSSLEVDHIKPRSLFKSMELDAENLQVLCKPCNASKGNRNERDYRQPG